MPYGTKTHSWISLIHRLLLGKIPKYLLIIQTVELSTKPTVMQQFLKCIIMTSLQKRFIVVLNSIFVEVTELKQGCKNSCYKVINEFVFGEVFERHDGLH